MDPLTIGLITAGIGAAGSIGGGFLAGKSNKPQESKLEKQKRKLIDDLLLSVNGGGSYNDLFSTDENAFQKSFVDPAKSIFNNQIAPQIQQNSIYGGQQAGTGLDDQLLRAGVDLDQLLNQSYMQYQEQGKNRKANTISNILGQQGGVQPGMNNNDILGNATSGYLTSSAFSDSISNIFNPKTQSQGAPPSPYASQPRKGYQSDFRQWDNMQLGDKRWGQQ